MPLEVDGAAGSVAPHGGVLVDRVVDGPFFDVDGIADAPSLRLSDADTISLINLATGCYSPLIGFMNEREYESVLTDRHLPSGVPWTVPILLRMSDDIARMADRSGVLRLEDPSGCPLGVLDVESTFVIDPSRHCRGVFGTEDTSHPGVRNTLALPKVSLGGSVRLREEALIQRPLLRSPKSHRAELSRMGGRKFVAFSTRNVCHLGHEHLHGMVLEWADVLGINVISGAMLPGSFLTDVVLDAYEFMQRGYYPKNRVILNEMRLPPIYAGPREAFLQATVLQNLGYTHFIVGRDHAGIGHFYPRYGSQQIFRDISGLAIEILPFAEPRYCRVCDKITSERSCRHEDSLGVTFNGRDVRRLLLERRHNELDGVMRPELVDFLLGLLEGRGGRPRRLFHE